MKRLIVVLSDVKHIGCYIALASLLLSAIFSFIVYPIITDKYELLLDPDFHGTLGFGLLENGTLSYFPDNQPTVNRGPVYPGMIAALLYITNGWWPYSVQAAQTILNSITCLLIYWISKTLWGKRVALLTSAAWVFHPFLIYTAKIMVETLIVFLFMSLVAGTLYLIRRPGVLRAILFGFILGISTLSKSTFLPFIIVIPVAIGFIRASKVSWKQVACIIITAIIIVIPWTIRNWKLTGTFIPVHLLVGLNFQIGDAVVDNYAKSPFSHEDLWKMGDARVQALAEKHIDKNMPRWEKDVLVDSVLLKESISRYLEDPAFFIKKLALNSFLFWTLSTSKEKTLFYALIQLPLFVIFIVSCIVILRQRGVRTIYTVHMIMVFLYFASHLPVAAEARLSVVLTPLMIIYALGLLKPVLDEDAVRSNTSISIGSGNE